MNSNVEEARRSALGLLAQTRRETREFLSALDPELVVNTDEVGWRVRDVIGHLGVWNCEAARSISAYAQGGQYHCISARGNYDAYNGPAAKERRAWSMEEVWAEYENAHARLQLLVETLPADKWNGEMVFPWDERGTVEQLIKRMMKHEKADHCEVIARLAHPAGS